MIFKGISNQEPGLTVLTTTAGRPLCFQLLTKWIERQTLQPQRWLIITDDYKGYYFNKIKTPHEIYRRTLKPGENSLCENWLRAFYRLDVKGKLVVMEDDDYYHPEYLEAMSIMLNEYKLVGLRKNLYYSLRDRKFRRCHNQDYSLLATTGINLEMKNFAQVVVNNTLAEKSVSIDVNLWTSPFFDNKALIDCEGVSTDNKPLHVGMKDMPGKAGLGMGLRGAGSTDKAFAVFDKWLGADAKAYKSIPLEAWEANEVQA